MTKNVRQLCVQYAQAQEALAQAQAQMEAIEKELNLYCKENGYVGDYTNKDEFAKQTKTCEVYLNISKPRKQFAIGNITDANDLATFKAIKEKYTKLGNSTEKLNITLDGKKIK